MNKQDIENNNVSESDFILDEIKSILKKKEEDMLWYISQYFTKDEINRHSENLLTMVGNFEGDIATIKMKLLGRKTGINL